MDIQPIKASERNLGGADYFILWAGVAISLAEIWAGEFLSPMGFWLGLCAIILGHVIGNTLMGLGGIIGSEYGIMSMVSVRPSFGIRGSNLAAVLNIIQLIGWASIMLIIGGRAGDMLMQTIGWNVPGAKHFWIILIGMGTLVWALYTGRTFWKVIQGAAVAGLMLVILSMTWVSFREFGAGTAVIPKGGMPFMTGLDIVIAMPISWLPLVADYSRMSKKTSAAFWNTWWGYFIVSSWMYILGLSSTLVTGQGEPWVLILNVMGKVGLAVPALMLVVFSTITSDFPDIYSATCSMMNISEKISAKTFMWIVGILSIVVALVFPEGRYEQFLLFIGAMFIPLFGIVLTDYFLLRKRRLQPEALYQVRGPYWYFRGFNITALISWAIGFAVYEYIAVKQFFIGGSIPSMLIAGALYFIFMQSGFKEKKHGR